MPSCTPPKGISVSSYLRSKPRKSRKGARTKPGETYWTCETPSGHTCGTHHRTITAADRHARSLNKQDRRQGRKAKWDSVKKRG